MNPQILLITMSGILIVFSMLVFFVFLFTAFGKVVSGLEERKKKKAAAKEAKASQPAAKPVEVKKAAAPAPAPVAEEGIPGAVIAAIAAAVAVMGEADGTTYTVRSVRRERSARPVWAAAGIIENTRPF